MKQKFIDLLKSTNRPGVVELIEFLDRTDFFTAPASTKYHNAFEGGLLAHSLNVYECLKELTHRTICRRNHYYRGTSS